MSLTAEQILKSDDFGPPVKVSVPEWGGDVYVRIISGSERDKWELATHDQMSKSIPKNVRAGLCAVCLCDEKGKRLFVDAQVVALGNKSATALDRVFDKAREINKIQEGDIEELEKN